MQPPRRQTLQERPGPLDGDSQPVQRLDLLDQADVVDVVAAVAVGQSAGRDQTQGFVVTNSLDGDAGVAGQFADRHVTHATTLNLALEGKVKHQFRANALSANPPSTGAINWAYSPVMWLSSRNTSVLPMITGHR